MDLDNSAQDKICPEVVRLNFQHSQVCQEYTLKYTHSQLQQYREVNPQSQLQNSKENRRLD